MAVSHEVALRDELLRSRDHDIATLTVALREARAENERLRAERNDAHRLIWLIVKSNGGYMLEPSDKENYPGDDRAFVTQTEQAESGCTILTAHEQSGDAKS